jgi:hypothetical protein
MKTSLMKLANILTIVATLFLVVGLVYVVIKNQPTAELISTASFCYVSIAVFNYLMFGAATLWHMKTAE